MDLIKIQENIKAQIYKSKVNFKKSPKDRLTKHSIETRMQTIDSKWEEFTKNHYAIIRKKETEGSEYFEDDLYGETEEFYLEFKAELKEMVDKCEPSPSKSQLDGAERENHKSFVKLPKISIPTFSGLYTEWLSFRDLFVSLIHNNSSIDNVQKLQYLKGHLSGEAAQLIQHVSITNDNYEQCWSLLDNRYNNKQYLANCILKQFFSQRNIMSESATAIKQLLDNTTNMLHSLSNLGIDTKSWDVIVIYIVSMKLDNDSRKNWEAKVSELTCNSDKLPNLDDFIEFLQKRFHSLEFLDPKLQNYTPYNKPQPNKARSVGGVHSLHVSQIFCVYCKRDHRISNCKEFNNLTSNSKRNFVQENRLCFNCMANNHAARHCRSPTSCQICHRRHHSLLHSSNLPQATVNKETVEKRPSDCAATAHVAQVSQVSEEETPTKSSFLSRGLCQYSLLATALVDAESSAGSTSQLRALIDPASHLSFVTEAVVQFLGLKRTHIKENLSGLGGEPSVVARAKTEVILHSSQNPQCAIRVEAYILEKLTGLLPPRKVEVESWPKLDSIKLADPEFNVPNKIDLLLGSDVYGLILKEGLIKGSSGSLLAQETIFGWILTGQNKSEPTSGDMVSMHVCADDLLKSFWELEEAPKPAKRIMSKEEQRCEDIFTSTTRRDESGRYIVKLPFRDENPACIKGQAREIALKRFLSLERRLEKDPHLKAEYKRTFDEYLKLNHMEAVDKEEYNKGLYLPYHAVIREDKETTKVRIVFDASCKGSNQVSLNDDLMVGPVLQPELRHIIMRWRTYSICFTADIVKMYRQVKVDPSDANFQRILWRSNPNDDIGEYRLLRVTFGTSSAPYLAVRTLTQLAIDEGENYPLAAERVKRDFYMDDFMSGCESEPEAIEIYKQMNGLLGRGGFTMQKWFSNNENIAKAMQEEAIVEEAEKKKLVEQMETNKILGLTWNRRHDEFEYAVKLPPRSEPVTKRKVISDISRLYDPLGWISPSIIKAKIFIQKLWISGLEWDEELPKHLYDEWIKYREDLEQLSNFHLPRWMKCRSDDQLTELHGFCDASNAAYGAVIYLRVMDSTGNIHISLITAKTRVAPVKQVSIPRLELCGGVLVAKLITEVAEVLDIPKSNRHAWTDSEVVLAWLSGHPNRWKTFVGNRVSEIMSHLDRNQWAYVKSEHNPSDCASRGVNPSDISTHRLWLNGPDWLKNEVVEYVNPKKCLTNLEEKGPSVHVTTADHNDDEMWKKFSSLTKLLRVVAYCKRILKKKKINHTYLLKEEINNALEIMIQKSQKQNFCEEIDSLRKGKEVNKKSTLTSLNPFLDDLGILRVGGRIARSQVDDNQKHPILIPHDSHLTRLLIADAHIRTLHGGPQLMLNYLRTKYWIIGAKTLTRFHFRKCVTCTRYRTQANNPLMGQLPAERVSATRAFLFSGVDYAGPINIRVSKGRGNKSYKGYICLFVCMSTKAIHLEAVSDLSSQGFLSAFKRFVARRGHCSDLYSDNATNFVGAARDLKELFEEQKKFLPEVSDWLATNGTAWHFIPPHSPNFGGLWEAGVKSTKNHLKRTIDNTTLTFEEMSTVLSQIEACLNSRPISQISTNPEDPMPLTPGHFLVGEPLILPPDRRYEQSTISTLRRWQLSQRMVQEFWKRWSQEYLMHLVHRYKWKFNVPEPELGDVVLVKEDGLPPARWLMGKIVEKHSGVDKVTRVVTLKCKDSLLKRPVSKLCVLPTTT